MLVLKKLLLMEARTPLLTLLDIPDSVVPTTWISTQVTSPILS